MSTLPYQTPRPGPTQPPNRAPRLLTFGVLLICLGAILSFISLSLPIGLFLSPRAPRTPAAAASLTLVSLPPFLLFAAFAVLFIWTGIASLRLRRWSRPVVLSVAGIFLFIGLVTLASYAVDSLLSFFTVLPPPTPPPRPRGLSAQQAAAQARSAAVLGYGIFALIFLVLPATFIAAYRPRDVQATLDDADPAPTWSDRIPIPALALSIALAFGGYCLLLSAFVPPKSPSFAPPIPATIAVGLLLTFAGLFFLAARLVYRKHPAGPWLALLLVALLAAGFSLAAQSVALFDPSANRLHNWSAQQAIQAYQDASLRGMVHVATFALPAIAYTLYVRRLLSRPTPPSPS